MIMSNKEHTNPLTSSIERVKIAIENLQKGKGILLVDDENRENEGDLIFQQKK